MRIAVDFGQGVGSDRGAVGIRSEEELIAQVGHNLVPLLVEQGHQIFFTRPKVIRNVIDSLQQRVKNSDRCKAALFLSIHFNCFNGEAHGSEVFAASLKGRNYAQTVQKNLVELGFFNRGVKDGSHLYVVKHTIAPAILIECCFCDSPSDMELFDFLKIAQAIANVIPN